MNLDPVVILLAEDDPDDSYLIGEALDESNLKHKLFVVENGEELLDYLYNRGKYSDQEEWPRPGLILLDLNMPRKDGREALGEIKSDPDLRRIPIVALTTSQAEEDIVSTYNWGISGYITKPMDFTTLLEVMRSLGRYWLEVVKLPPK
ncbi:MAG: response regulator [Anaerolineales bacterium]|nr:response regulator [Anaerolineales bacterium]